MIEKRLASLRSKFKIPNLIILRAPKIDARPCSAQGDEVAIYMDAIYSRLRLSVEPFLRRVLHAMSLAPI